MFFFNATNSPDGVGKSALIREIVEPLVFSNHFLRLRTDPERLVPGYLARWLQIRFEHGLFQAMCRQWVNQATVGREALLSLPLALPSLPEQRRIAEVLDRADELRTKRRAALVLFESLIPSIFVEMFGDQAANPHGWPSRPLAALIASGDRLNYGVIQPGENVSGGVPLIRVGDLVGGRVDRSAIKCIDARIDAGYPRSRLRGEEILVSCVGTIGVVALAGPEDAGSNIARAVARVRLGTDVERDYIAAYLRQPAVQRYFTGELRTVTQPTLNIKQLAETPILLPPLELQRAFCDRVSACSSVRDECDAQSSRLDILFASLQQRAFEGEL